MEDVIEYFENLGLSEFIKDENGNLIYAALNLDMARQIVEGYFEGQYVDDDLKKAVLQAVLGKQTFKLLNGTGHIHYLSTLKKRLHSVGFSNKEIYGMIINLSINKSVIDVPGYNYYTLSSNTNDKCPELRGFGDKVETTVMPFTIQKAKSEHLSESEKSELHKYYEDIGLSEFIRDTNGNFKYLDCDLYMARQIVEGYLREHDVKDEEILTWKKAVLQCVLGNCSLEINDPRNFSVLAKLMHKLEKIGLSEQEIYGGIINLGLNMIKIAGKGYGYFLNKFHLSHENIVEDLLTMKRLGVLSADVILPTRLYEYFDNLGCSDTIKDENGKLIYSDCNLNMARQIAEGFLGENDYAEDDRNKERIMILHSLLDCKELKNRPLGILTLMESMDRAGLTKKEIYGMLINLGLKMIDVDGKGYRTLLSNPTLACEVMLENIPGMKREGMLAVEVILPERLYEYFDNLGLARFIRNKAGKLKFSDSDLYMARQIIERYFEAQSISGEEKSALLSCILKISILKDKQQALWTIMQNLRKSGFDRLQTYGMIINLGVKGKIQEHSYSEVLTNKDNVCDILFGNRDAIETEVTEETIETAGKKRRVGKKAIADAAMPVLCIPGGHKLYGDVVGNITGLKSAAARIEDSGIGKSG